MEVETGRGVGVSNVRGVRVSIVRVSKCTCKLMSIGVWKWYVLCYNSSMRYEGESRLYLANEMRKALERGIIVAPEGDTYVDCKKDLHLESGERRGILSSDELPEL
jgi:hypothetical protein